MASKSVARFFGVRGDFGKVLNSLSEIYELPPSFRNRGGVGRKRLEELRPSIEALRGQVDVEKDAALRDKNILKYRLLDLIWRSLEALVSGRVEDVGTFRAEKEMLAGDIRVSGKESSTFKEGMRLLGKIIELMNVYLGRKSAAAEVDASLQAMRNKNTNLLRRSFVTVGMTPEQLRNAATAQHERMESRLTDEQKERKAQLYAKIQRVYGYRPSNFQNPHKSPLEAEMFVDFFKKREQAKKELGKLGIPEYILNDNDEREIQAQIEEIRKRDRAFASGLPPPPTHTPSASASSAAPGSAASGSQGGRRRKARVHTRKHKRRQSKRTRRL